MTVTLEIPEELAQRLGSRVDRMSSEALAIEAHRQGLWTETELLRFWDDLERERDFHRKLSLR